MADLTVTKITDAGLNVTTLGAAASGGDQFLNNGRVMLIAEAGATTFDVTVSLGRSSVAVRGYPDMAKTAPVVTVPANGRMLIGPFPELAYNSTAGKVLVTYSNTTTATVQAVELPDFG